MGIYGVAVISYQAATEELKSFYTTEQILETRVDVKTLGRQKR